MGSRRRVFVSLYAASGAAALVYEVAWTRLLTLQLGHTVAAASTVLAAFMGGLATGAWTAGRRSVPEPLRAYAILELFVAATAIALPFALSATVPALAWAYADGTAPARFAIVRVAISLALVGLPAAAMGATFPIAAQWFARDAADTGLLYAGNTAGAAAGAIAAGFFLIPAFGLRSTTWIGVALNVAAAGGALWLSRQTETAERAESAAPHSGKAKKKIAPRSLRSPRLNVDADTRSPTLACAAAALSGFAALVYEVAWTRLLALVIGPTTYAFATMAASFIAGLAIGSAAGARVARTSARPAVWLASMLIVSSLGAAAAAYIAASRLPLIVAAEVIEPNLSFTSLVMRQAATTALLLLPMTLALGATFPLALAVASGGASTTGADAARVYTANTIGAISGALSAGFALVPWLGLQTTFRATAILGALGGAVCLTLAGRQSSAASRRPSQTASSPPLQDVSRPPGPKLPAPAQLASIATVVLASLAIILLLPPWDRQLLASGAYKYAPYLGATDLETVLRAGDLLYYKEG